MPATPPAAGAGTGTSSSSAGAPVQRFQLHVTIPDPGYRSSSESRGSAPSRSNSQAQKSGGFAPTTAPGRVERRRGARPASASTAWGAEPGSCRAPANTTGSHAFSRRAVRVRPRATHPRRDPLCRGLARRLWRGSRTARQPTSTAPTRHRPADAQAAPRDRPLRRSRDGRGTTRSCRDRADRRKPGAAAQQPSRRAERDGSPHDAPLGDSASSSNARRRATPTPAQCTTRTGDPGGVAGGPARRSRRSPGIGSPTGRQAQAPVRPTRHGKMAGKRLPGCSGFRRPRSAPSGSRRHRREGPKRQSPQGIQAISAEGVGFEPTVGGLPLQRFSRPPDSATLAPLRGAPAQRRG
jgi:hypothetical protein